MHDFMHELKIELEGDTFFTNNSLLANNHLFKLIRRVHNYYEYHAE